MKTLLVDDEFLAVELLANFLEQVSDIELVGKCTSPIRALELLNQQSVDLLFLDIQMPLLSGINLLQTLRSPPVTILTTAYSDYAVAAFDLNVADYLLKPFSFDRLLRALGRARSLIQPSIIPMTSTPSTVVDTVQATDFLTVKTDGKLIRISLADIWFLEAYGEYVWVVGPAGRMLVLHTLRYFEELLPRRHFLRTHRSYLVAVAQIRVLEGNELTVGPYKVPVSRDKRADVLCLF